MARYLTPQEAASQEVLYESQGLRRSFQGLVAGCRYRSRKARGILGKWGSSRHNSRHSRHYSRSRIPNSFCSSNSHNSSCSRLFSCRCDVCQP